MSPKSRVRSTRSRGHFDRFGYRPSPAKHVPAANVPYEARGSERQQLLDKIKYDRLERTWGAQRIDKGREGWHGFGNKELPIERYRHDIMRMVATNRISLLAGETGSGKSTQLAQYALEMGYDRIVYLQPRRVTTDAISERIEAELAEQFMQRNMEMPEHLVGMSHSERSTMQPDSVIQIMTSAVFKMRAPELREQWKDERVLIVADEVHEGNIETEFAVATAAELMTDHEQWNMVLMSATLNEAEIQDAYMPINGRKIPSVSVEGRPHTIEQHERPEKTVLDVFAEECREDDGKTIVFTDGKRSVKQIMDELVARYGDSVKVLPLHSKIDDATRREIFHGSDIPGVQTVIVSTSAGQSGLTIPGLKYVISDGWTKSPELDDENSSGLPRRLCSRAELTQQMGRGGRDIQGGKFFLACAIDTKGRYRSCFAPSKFIGFDSHEREEHIPADIYHTVITRNVLSAAAMDRDFYTLNAYLIHKVTQGTIREAYAVLRLMGAVDEHNQATDIGKKMDRYPLRPELSRALVEVLQSGSVMQQLQVAAIAAAIEAGGLAGPDLEKRNERLSTDTKDDFTAELDLFMGALKYLKPTLVTTTREDLEKATIHVCDKGYVPLIETLDEKTIEKLLSTPHVSYDLSDTTSMSNAGIDPQNALRAYKQFDKICKRAGINREDQLSLTNTFGTGERAKIHEFFLAGMPHLIYEEVRRQPNRGRTKRNGRGEKQPKLPYIWFRNILGPEKTEKYSFDRQIGNRSVMAALALPKESVVAGYPRWYEDDDGDVHNIIDKAFLTSRTTIRRVLGGRAMDLREATVVGPDGRLQLLSDTYLGRMRTGRTRTPDHATTHSKVDRLAKAATEMPGPALRELRTLKRWLDDLARRVPQKRMSYYFERPVLGNRDLDAIVREAAKGAGSVGELDANIRARAINYEQFITPEKLRAINENMPTELEIGGSVYKVHYNSDAAQPMIYEFPVSSAGALPEKLIIRDGREVMFRYTYSEDDVRILTTDEVRQMAGL